MNSGKIQKILTSLDRTNPTQFVKIVFNEKTGIVGFRRLAGLLTSQSNIRLANESENVLLCAVCDGGWGAKAVANRTFVVQGLRNASDKALREILKDVDTIEVVDNNAKRLLTGRKKMCEAFVEELTLRTLTVTFLNEMEEWEVYVESHQHTLEDGTPAICFKLIHDENVFHELIIDGFTGLVSLNRCPYESPEQLRHILSLVTDTYMEDVTRPSIC